MKKIGLLALGLALSMGIVAEAGSIPTNRVPLHTYAIKYLDCYLQPNGIKKGYIDAGDYVIVEQIRSDGWAYGSYPVGKTRTKRWFKADDLVNNIGFANQDRYSPKSNTYVYRNPNHNQQMGSFNNNEDIVVVSDSGDSRQVIYKLSNGNGYKMGWVPYWDCWDARQAGKQEVNNNTINKNPIVTPVKREDTQKNNSLSCGCSTSYAGSYVVNTSRLPLTMRSGHGSNYSKIASIPKGATVTVSASNGTWAHVNYNGRDGYASMQYLKKNTSGGTSSALADAVNRITNINTSENYIWPVDCYKISTLYYYYSINKENNYQHSSGWSKGEGAGEFDHHDSIDIAVPLGYDVKATASGTVIYSGWRDGYGNAIVIKHAGDVYSLYGHLNSRKVTNGSNVNQGDVIGKSGNTGNSTNAHLHFAISKFNDSNMNTWKYFRDKYDFIYPTKGIKANQQHANSDSYSKEAIQWLNNHQHKTW